jgi:hypothetical protein
MSINKLDSDNVDNPINTPLVFNVSEIKPTEPNQDEYTEEDTNVDKDLNETDDPNRKTLTSRIFSKMEDGSLRASIIAMSSLALGTGCFALPIRFAQMSFVCAIAMLIIGSIASYWSLVIMIEAGKKKKITDYSRLVKESLGNRMALILDLVILICILGILISYQVISNTLNNI